MKFLNGKIYKDGVVIKHVKNRSVCVFTNKNPIGGIIIEFAKADVSKEDIMKPCAVNRVIRNKVQVTGIPISDEAALGLYYCLQHYYTKVAPLPETGDDIPA